MRKSLIAVALASVALTVGARRPRQRQQPLSRQGCTPAWTPPIKPARRASHRVAGEGAANEPVAGGQAVLWVVGAR
jgi:hypothetical protein